ncbi:MAG: DNA-3-methyladenine glycosylase I [Candidatus Neomarinimicrobiota bacterium]|nr:MAG: DNA-3-methyladenine glycosylase I [Candidatus Neomarinimicrobiota bacterium]
MVVEKPKTYCDYIKDLDPTNIHRIYHDEVYGFPLESDNELFGRLVLEINQAGLSWETILKKEANFRKAYDSFDIVKVANYLQSDIERLLHNKGIIRNKLKINAAVYNAQRILELQKEHGSFKAWLNMNHPLSLDEWVKLFKKTFKFTGGEITNEFLVSTGYLEGAHDLDCPIYDKIIQEDPMWNKTQ